MWRVQLGADTRTRAEPLSVPSCLQRPLTVLLTSVGNEALPGFGHDLRLRAPTWRLIGTDMRDDPTRTRRCDAFHRVPARSDPAYLPELLRICQLEQVDLLLPLSTRDQDFFSAPSTQEAIRSALGPVPVVVSDEDAVARANTKIALFECMGADSALLPPSRVVDGPDQALAALKELCAEHGAALLKADQGTGAQGMLRVGRPGADAAPAEDALWLSIERAQQELSAEQGAGSGLWPRQVVAYLPGAEYSVDVLCDAGEVLAGVVRLRLASRGGLATDSVVVADADVMEAARAVVRATRLSYVANVQFRRDASGAPRLLEVNPRIPGTIGLSVNGGLNLPLAAMCQALGEKLPLPEPSLGLRALRHGDVLYTLHRFGAQPGADHEHCGALPELIEGDEPTFVLWDLDGTLVRLQVGLDDISAWKQSLQERFEDFGWTGGWSPLLPSLEAALEQAADQLSDQQAEELRQQCYSDLDQWEEAALRGVLVADEVVRLLTDLSRCELHMALVSNNGPLAVGRGLSALDEHLSAIGAGTTGLSAVVARGPGLRAKPCEDMFVAALRLLERQHGEAARIVCVGDAPGDLDAAAALHRSIGLPVDFLGIH